MIVELAQKTVRGTRDKEFRTHVARLSLAELNEEINRLVIGIEMHKQFRGVGYESKVAFLSNLASCLAKTLLRRERAAL